MNNEPFEFPPLETIDPYLPEGDFLPDAKPKPWRLWADTVSCPKCRAWVYDLWQYAGLTFYKCGHCGYRSPDL